jgi:hypothetical protein
MYFEEFNDIAILEKLGLSKSDDVVYCKDGTVRIMASTEASKAVELYKENQKDNDFKRYLIGKRLEKLDDQTKDVIRSIWEEWRSAEIYLKKKSNETIDTLKNELMLANRIHNQFIQSLNDLIKNDHGVDDENI